MATATIPLTIEQAGGAPYAGARSDDTTLVTAVIEGLTATTGRLVLSAKASHTPGTFNTTVRALACSDSACQNVTRTETYPVSVTILPPLKVSQASVAMTAFEATSQQIDITVSTPGAGTLSAKVDASSGAWLAAQVVDAGTLRLTASAGTRPAGSLQGALTVGFDRGGGAVSSLNVPVAFTIGKGLAAPAAQQMTLNVGTLSGALVGSVPVGRTDKTPVAWTASSSADWLVLSPPAGTSASTLGYAVDLAKTGGLKSFADHTATVTISAGALTPVSFPVVLQKRLPFIGAAMPYGIPAGVGSRVMVGGGGFTQVQNLAGSLQTGGLSVTNLQVISDKLIAFTVTPPQAGSFQLSLGNASSAPVQQGVLKVAAVGPYASATVPNAGNVDQAVHDPVRQAVFAIGGFIGNALYKYQHAAGAWSITSQTIDGPNGLALSPDGTRLFVSTPTKLLQFNPDTLQLTATYPTPEEKIEPSTTINGMAVTADNRIWLPTSYMYTPMRYLDLNDNSFGHVARDFRIQRISESARFVAPADGSSLLAGSSFTGEVWAAYDPATAAMSGGNVGFENEYQMSFSIDGSRILRSYGRLYDNAFKPLGQVSLTQNAYRTALSPDSAKVYALIATPGPGVGLTFSVNVFSTTGFLPGTTDFAPLGPLKAGSQAANCSPSCPYGYNEAGVLLPSLDGKTLFWLGNKGMEVFRLP